MKQHSSIQNADASSECTEFSPNPRLSHGMDKNTPCGNEGWPGGTWCQASGIPTKVTLQQLLGQPIRVGQTPRDPPVCRHMTGPGTGRQVGRHKSSQTLTLEGGGHLLIMARTGGGRGTQHPLGLGQAVHTAGCTQN